MKLILNLLILLMLITMFTASKSNDKKTIVAYTVTFKNAGERAMRFLVFNKIEEVRTMLVALDNFHLNAGATVTKTYSADITDFVKVVPDVSKPNLIGHDNRLFVGRFCPVAFKQTVTYNGSSCIIN